MSIASVFVMVCCLVMTGIAFVVHQNIKNSLQNIEKNNSITVYLNYGITPNLDDVKNKICSIDNIDSCTLHSKEDGVRECENILGGNYISDIFEGEENPLPDAFRITMKDFSIYNETVNQIMNIEEVSSISDKSDIAKKLSDLKKLVSIIGFWVNVGLAVVSLMIISNTIRITMYNRRFEISIMKSVGATNMFIRTPFIIEGFLLGLISASLSIAILNLIFMYATSLINNIIPLNNFFLKQTLDKLIFVFMASGGFLGVFASLISIKKYLKKEGGLSVAW